MKIAVPSNIKRFIEIYIRSNDVIKGQLHCTCGFSCFIVLREKWEQSIESKEDERAINEIEQTGTE